VFIKGVKKLGSEASPSHGQQEISQTLHQALRLAAAMATAASTARMQKVRA
jgi:hypothetical protein